MAKTKHIPARTNGEEIVTDTALNVSEVLFIPVINTASPTLGDYTDYDGRFVYNQFNKRLYIRDAGAWFSFLNTVTDYLPINGGTLTGALVGTTANFTTNGRFAQLGIGGVPPAGINIYNIANLTGATSAYGNFTSVTIQSGVTGQAMINRSTAGTAAASFTLPTLVHYYADQGTFGAGSTVTNQYGFYAAATLIGGTNNYGFFGTIPAGTGRYNLHMGGTAQNYLVGNLGLGVPIPLATLHFKAGTATANTAPQKFTSGVLLTTPEVGAFEFLTDRLHFTQTTGATRQQLAYVSDNKEIVLNKTANYTVTVADFAGSGQISLYVDATSGNIDITIPTVANMLGYTLNVFKTDTTANTVTITGVSANINGSATKVLSSQYAFTEIHSNNTQYYAK